MLIKGNSRADNRDDGCIEAEGDGSTEIEGEGSTECMLRAGELKQVEGGGNSRSIWNNPEPDGNVPGAEVAPNHVVLYGEYHTSVFFRGAVSSCACCCTSSSWFRHNLR